MKYLFLSFLFSCSYKSSISTSLSNLNQSVSESSAEFVISEDESISFPKTSIGLPLDKIDSLIIQSSSSDNAKILWDFNSKTFTYTPHPDYHGTDKAQVRYLDGGVLKFVKIKVQVLSKEDNPSLHDDHVTFESNQTLEIEVLKNDIDVDGDSLFLESIEEHPDLDLRIVDNKVVFDVAENFSYDDLTQNFINYSAKDSKGNSTSAKINLLETDEILVDDKSSIGLRVLFLGSSDEVLTQVPNEDAFEALRILNQKFKDQSIDHLNFKLLSSEYIEDDELFIMCDPTDSSCIDYDRVVNKYSKEGEVTLVFVKKIQGAVEGIARVDRLPQSNEALVVSEYNHLKTNDEYLENANVYVHELGHLVGLRHTHQVGSEANDVMDYYGCSTYSTYFQKGGELVDEIYNDGIYDWDYYGNFMKSVLSKQSDLDLSFFTEGYSRSFSAIFNCYRARSLSN